MGKDRSASQPDNQPKKAKGVPPFFRSTAEGTILYCRVQPRASRDEVVWNPEASELKIRVTAPPVENEANDRLCRFLAKKLGCGRSQVRILSGERSRTKQVLVVGMGIEEVRSRLESS